MSETGRKDEEMFKAGSRVTWYSDSNYWGTVTDVRGAILLVRWDSGLEGSVEMHDVRLRGAR